MQQPALFDKQKVLLVNKIIQGGYSNLNVLKSKLYLASFALKSFEKLDVNAQVELIKPQNMELIGILDFIIKGVSEISLMELEKPIWSKNSLRDHILISFGVMLHGLHAFSLKSLIINLIQNLIGKTLQDVEVFVLDMFQILFEIGTHSLIY